ncbi:MAG: ABC transporter permease [Prevotellaceae bacterium]|jgi:ABC-2 type transport system permease protein|nr:ABC transporter permease [Prevotellaceae bacterium]
MNSKEKNSARALKYLLQKEFLQIFRDKTILRMILVIPIVQLLVLPWAATFEQRNISLSILDGDRSEVSRKLSQRVLASGFFRLAHYPASYSQAIEAVERNQADLILEIPAGFERRLISEKNSQIMLSVNAVNGQKAGLGSSYASQIIGEINAEMLSNEGQNPRGRIDIRPSFRYNTAMNYRNFMVPGIIVMLVTLIGGMLASMNIVKEKESGTIEQINVTPVSKSIFILGKLIPFWTIGLFVLSAGIFVVRIVYGLSPEGKTVDLYLFSFVYLLACSGLGLLISTYSNTQQQAMLLSFFFLMIFFMMSGLFTPISSMPEWAQLITRFNPVRYFIEVMRLVYMKGSSLADIIPQLLHIAAFALFFNAWAIANYKKTSY